MKLICQFAIMHAYYCFDLLLLFPGVPKAARTVSEAVIVRRVNVEVDNARALLLTVNVIQMFVEIVGLGRALSL
jgi:hypothetical protein